MAMEAPTSCSSESLKHSGLRRACGGPLIQPLHLSHCSSPCQALSYPRGESPTTSSRNLLWCVTSHSVFPLTCFNFLRYLRLLPLARPLFVSDRAGVADAGSPGRLPRPTTPVPAEARYWARSSQTEPSTRPAEAPLPAACCHGPARAPPA